jgi:hypothetical protein
MDAEFENHDQDILWPGVNEDELNDLFDVLDVSDARRRRWLNVSPA